jgi:hypothetical protein
LNTATTKADISGRFSRLIAFQTIRGGDYNNGLGSTDTLQGAHWNDFKTSNVYSAAVKSKDVGILSAEGNEQAKEKKEGKNTNQEINPEYVKLNSKEALESYKAKANEKLKAKNNEKGLVAQNAQNQRFTITFNEPQSFTEVKKVLNNKAIKTKSVYARALNAAGDRLTMTTVDFSDEVINSITSNSEYTFKGFTEIEGEAPAAELLNLASDPNVFAVEIEDEETGAKPIGLTWKKENLYK